MQLAHAPSRCCLPVRTIQTFLRNSIDKLISVDKKVHYQNDNSSLKTLTLKVDE